MMQDQHFVDTGSVGMHYSEIKEMSDEEQAERLAGAWQHEARRVIVPEGALLLWNSRTVHTGWKGGPRLAQTVCLEPAQQRPENERVAKYRLAALGLPSVHWARAAMQHDMSLNSLGVFEYRRVEAEDGDGHPDTVVLPLRPAIRPAALAEDADMEGLSKLVRVHFKNVGMWDPIEGSASLLEASIKEDFKKFL